MVKHILIRNIKRAGDRDHQESLVMLMLFPLGPPVGPVQFLHPRNGVERFLMKKSRRRPSERGKPKGGVRTERLSI